MILRSASPAAARGRRGGRATGLLPASLVTAAAARFSARRRESSRKDLGKECLFSCREGEDCFKMVWPHKSWSTHHMFIKLSQVPFVV